MAVSQVADRRSRGLTGRGTMSLPASGSRQGRDMDGGAFAKRDEVIAAFE